MALQKCPECGGKLSSHATKCPHCGIDGDALVSARVYAGCGTAAGTLIVWGMLCGFFLACMGLFDH